ncbi:dual specificity protein phosphatase 10 isoform X2 [Nematostella vectensis]|uniref:dual specificity protein phosphatase 10 isoform X2 n=1 Tax=Nematostella vectensis TaxID=45351 RepID=UPI0020779523|nr:dual specificity protein phosphatase 10 isoform X2 [Nematostella vectensis]
MPCRVLLPLTLPLAPNIGGLREFCKTYDNLCEHASPRICHPVGNCGISELSAPDLCPTRPRGPPASSILPFLFLGSEEGAADEDLIDRLAIKFILNLTPVCPNFFSEREDIIYKRIQINDSYQEDIGQHFDEAIAFIDEARSRGSSVLVHCHAGVSRSATVTVAYVMQHLGLSLNEAYQFVKEKRPTISPNLNFMGHLLKYEKNKKNEELKA